MLRNESMNLWWICRKPKIASGVIEWVLPFLHHGGKGRADHRIAARTERWGNDQCGKVSSETDPFLMTRTSTEGTVLADYISVVTQVEGPKLLMRIKYFCALS